MRRTMLAAVLWMTACPASDDIDPSKTSPTETTDTGTTNDTDTSTTSTETHSSTDTGTPTDTHTTSDAVVDALSAQLHPEFGSVVVVGWEQAEAATVHMEFSADGEPAMSSPPRALSPGHHEELLLGVPYGADVTWSIVVESDSGTATLSGPPITTQTAPPSLPQPTLWLEGAYEQGVPWILVSAVQDGENFGRPWWTMIVDRKGRPVWARLSQSSHVSMHPRVSWDGSAVLIDQNRYWSEFDLDLGTVEKLTLDGEVVTTWETPGLHHPYQEMPDGSLAWGSFTTDSYSEVLLVRRPDGSLETLFDCDSWLLGQGYGTTPCASNTLNYDEASDTFLFSFWTLETVFHLDASSGDVLATFGSLATSYDFDPPSSHFWFQHGPHITPDGTLMISTHVDDDDHELVVREYEIDDSAGVLREVWNAGVGDGVIGNQMGDAYHLPGSDHVLQTFGTQPRMREFTNDGTVVWDVSYPSDNIGRATGLIDLYQLAGVRP